MPREYAPGRGHRSELTRTWGIRSVLRVVRREHRLRSAPDSHSASTTTDRRQQSVCRRVIVVRIRGMRNPHPKGSRTPIRSGAGNPLKSHSSERPATAGQTNPADWGSERETGSDKVGTAGKESAKASAWKAPRKSDRKNLIESETQDRREAPGGKPERVSTKEASVP
jgi:hypothetical protein